jgi:cytochrome c oxidase subunit 4
MSTSAHSAVAHDDAHPEGPSVMAYFVIFIALLVLLFISVAVAYIPSQGSIRDLLTLIGFTIASIKAVLIILYFMHVKFGSRLTWLFAFGSFFFLLIMVGLTMNDYATRHDVVSGERGFSRESGDAVQTEQGRIHPEPADTK